MASADIVPERAALRNRYERHQPETTVLYQVVQAWLETFVAMAAEAYQRPLPRYVQQEFQKYLRCGILAWGFARAYCRSWGASMLVAWSCKLRGVCPSCGARRASQTAVNLVDRVLPRVRVRQWVLSVPYELRLLLAKDPAMLSAVVRILYAEVSRLTKRLGEERGIRQGATGMVAALQMFGGSLNLSEHVVPKPDKAEALQSPLSKSRGKTIDAADTLAGAGTGGKQPEPGPASHRGCVAAATN